MFRKALFSAAAAALLSGVPASAMTLKEFRKFSSADQNLYIGAAVSILAYSHAANGQVEKARCIRQWLFGSGKDSVAPGVRVMMRAIAPGNFDEEKFHIEGIVLGAVDKACPVVASNLKP